MIVRTIINTDESFSNGKTRYADIMRRADGTSMSWFKKDYACSAHEENPKLYSW